MTGDLEKAKAAFQKASDMKFTAGTFDLVDVLLFENKLDEAKNLMKRSIEEAAPGKEKSLQPMADSLAWIGTEAPVLEGAVNVGEGEAPTTLKEKPTLLYYWFMTHRAADAGLASCRKLQQQWGDTARAIGISTYDHFNPENQKVEPDMAPDKEQFYYKEILKRLSTGAAPACLLVPEALMKEKLHLGMSPGQKIILDKNGKFRWIRLTPDGNPYDWFVADAVVKKLLAE
jgi:hypothetical protein